jgi:hypothetical protein
VVQASRRDPDVPSHRPVDPVPKPFPGRAQVVQAAAAHEALAANARRRLADDAVPFTEAPDGTPDFGDSAAELVAEDHWHFDRPGLRVPRLMDVGAADRHSSHLEQDVTIVNLGDWDFSELDRERLERVLNDCGLGWHIGGPHSNSGVAECKSWGQ